MKYKAILLDFYGTCVAEDDEIIERIISRISNLSGVCTQEILKSWHFNELCAKSYGDTFRTQQEIERITLQEVLDKFKIKLDVNELSEELFEYWGNPKVYQDTQPFLTAQNVPVCILSNIDNSFLESALLNIEYEFRGIITSENVRSYKPRPEIYQAALSLLGVHPTDVVHIGDSFSSDVIGAANSNIDSIWINRRNNERNHPMIKQKVRTLSEIVW